MMRRMVTSLVTSEYHTLTAWLLHSLLNDRSNARARFDGHYSETRLASGMSRERVVFCVNPGPPTPGVTRRQRQHSHKSCHLISSVQQTNNQRSWRIFPEMRFGCSWRSPPRSHP
jgi:hypothetical protein